MSILLTKNVFMQTAASHGNDYPNISLNPLLMDFLIQIDSIKDGIVHYKF